MPSWPSGERRIKSEEMLQWAKARNAERAEAERAQAEPSRIQKTTEADETR